MSPEEPTTQQTAAEDMAVRSPAYEPAQDSDWLEEPDELPRRPRRKLLAPVPLTLLGILLVACGFIGGVEVQKGETSSSGSSGGTAGLASRFAALRGSGSSTAATASGSSAGAAGGFFGRSGGGAGAGATVGQVAYISGSVLYVTTAEGNTVKVTTSQASTITKTVKAHVKGIHPGETVIVTGAAGTGGAISAESIRVSEAGAGGGLGGLFGGGRSARGLGGAGAAAKGGEPALFGG